MLLNSAMHCFYKRICFICLLLLPAYLIGQEQKVYDDDFVIASIVLADPGDLLYSTVGHVGIHMECPQHNLNYVFSYESEDASHKVLAFLAGRLKMGMFAIPFDEYLDLYKLEGRGVRQYTLNLPIEVKRNLWRVLDNHLLEGANLPYDYIKRGCAFSTLSLLKEALDTIPIQYEEWPELFSHLTRRELVQVRMDNHLWTRCFLHLVGNGILDRDCSKEEMVIIPSDLVYVLQHATIHGEILLSTNPKVLLPNNNVTYNYWLTPSLIAAIVLILTVICSLFKFGFMDYFLLTIQTILGIITVYLIFFSNLVCTEWSWLIIPFNPLPLLLWKLRRRWCLPYAMIITLWALFMLLWPHTLTDNTYIILAFALVASYVNMFRVSKK